MKTFETRVQLADEDVILILVGGDELWAKNAREWSLSDLIDNKWNCTGARSFQAGVKKTKEVGAV
jgi:hypothetical protein